MIGFGLLMLYGRFAKGFPQKWLNLNDDFIIDELHEFDPIEVTYASEIYPEFINRISDAKTYD